MTAPRLEIDLRKIRHNAVTLVALLAGHGISVTGVTKAMLGSPDLVRELVGSGVGAIGDSRIENLEACGECIAVPRHLIRAPMLSQVDRVVAGADVSFNTELDVISRLSSAAEAVGRIHGIVLMVELGDLREGILPGDLEAAARQTLRFPNVVLLGIGANLACRSGVSPDVRNMAELSTLACRLESRLDMTFEIVSGGNSANIAWALGAADRGRINELRLGESILLGREALHRRPIEGLHTDAITLVTEVIESKVKPSRPWGDIAEAAFGSVPPATDRGLVAQTILAIGRQDTDPDGLTPPCGIEILGSSSDHLVVDSGSCLLPIGTEVPFQLNYSALLRAMTSPLVGRVWKSARDATPPLRREAVVPLSPAAPVAPMHH